MSLSTKETKMEYTKRIGMISGAYIKIADTKNYNEIITNEIEIPERMIEVRKQFVYEKNMRSKMMVVYAVEKEASKIDLQLTSMDTPTFQYLSFKHSSSEEQLGAMHTNEVINVKAHFETLYNVNLEQDVKY